MNGLDALIDYYRTQGAPEDQQMLIALLREAQELLGGMLTDEVLEQFSQKLVVRRSMLDALIRRVPSLRTQDAPHRLEVCSRCGASLAGWIEERFRITSGGVSQEGGFSYRVTPCMKNCRCGPSIKWDGNLHSFSNEELVIQLTQNGKKC